MYAYMYENFCIFCILLMLPSIEKKMFADSILFLLSVFILWFTYYVSDIF